MSILPWIQGATAQRERLVGEGNATYADVLNRALRQALTDSGLDPDADFPGFLTLLGGALNGPLTVTGVLTAAGGVLETVQLVTKTANYAVSATDRLVLVDTTGGAVQITLPTVATRGAVPLTIKNLGGANACTVVASGADSIDEATQLSLQGWESLMLIGDNGARYTRVNRVPGSGGGGGGGGGTVAASDVQPGVFPVGGFTFPGAVDIGGGATVTGLALASSVAAKGGTSQARAGAGQTAIFEGLDLAGAARQDTALKGGTLQLWAGPMGSEVKAVDISSAEIVANLPIRAAAGVLGEAAVRVVTANTTTTADDQILLVDATAGPITITLGQISTIGRRVEQLVRRIDASANAVALAPSGTDVLDGPATVAVGQTVDLLADLDATPDTWRSLGTSSSGGAVSAADVQPGTFTGAFVFTGGSLQLNGTTASTGSGTPFTFSNGVIFNSYIKAKARSVGNVSGAVTWNIADGWSTRAVLIGDLTLTLAGWYTGYSGRIVLLQDATGGHVLTMPGAVILPTGFAMPSAPNAGLIMDLFHDGTDLRVVGYSTF